jgi:predicted dehydrogenase
VSRRVLLVGYGSAARGLHQPLLSAAGLAPSVVVAANPERVARARADLPGVRVVPDLATALRPGSGEPPELAVLASPTGVHVRNALACIEAGVVTVVDKPLATSAVDAAQVVRAARAAGVALTVFQNRRWDPEQRALTRLLADGRLGQVHRFERRWERWRPVPKDRWRENAAPQDGGGLLLDLGSHLVDAALTMFGPVSSVYAEVSAWTTRADDEFFLTLTHASGVRSHLTGSSVAGAPGPRTRVLGSAAAYVATQFEDEQHVFGFDDAPGSTGWLATGESREPVPAEPGGIEVFYAGVRDALDLPRSEQQQAMPVDPQDAVDALAVLDAGRVSATEHRVVDLPSGR